jgi:hypothetical protein
MPTLHIHTHTHACIHIHTHTHTHTQMYAFYEAIAMLIFAETNPTEQQKLILELMKLPNATWSNLMVQVCVCVCVCV